MKKKLIEFVDTGDYGRAPLAKMIAQDYLKKVEAIGEYKTISSGTKVNEIASGNQPLESMLKTINLAKQRELYNPSELKKIEEALEIEDIYNLKKFFIDAQNFFSKEDKQAREFILKKLNLPRKIKQHSEQTIARGDTIAVFPLDKRSYQDVLRIYSETNFNPLISLLSFLSTGNQNSEIPNSFGRGLKVYEKSIEQLVNEIPIAIKKIIHCR